jgi:hypothetical protein
MPEPSKTEIRILKLKSSRTRVLSIGRNEVLGERYDTYTYELPSGRKVVVKTLSQMERCDGRK